MVLPVPWSDELERAAAALKPLPDGLTFAEKTLYIAMRGLYAQFKQGTIDRDQAKREKRLLLNDFGQIELADKARERSVKAWRWVDLSLNKCECPECAALKKTILQLENTF